MTSPVRGVSVIAGGGTYEEVYVGDGTGIGTSTHPVSTSPAAARIATVPAPRMAPC
jgi:hypothetical protein